MQYWWDAVRGLIPQLEEEVRQIAEEKEEEERQKCEALAAVRRAKLDAATQSVLQAFELGKAGQSRA